MNIGIMFGCFIPLHSGHLNLIKKALSENDTIIIGVCGYEDDRGKDFLNFSERFNLITERFKDNKNIIIVKIDDRKLNLDGTFTLNNWIIWCNEMFTNAKINPFDKTIKFNWYTGEKSYIKKLNLIYPHHTFNLIDRNIINISGTKIRNNFEKYKQYIDTYFYEYLKTKFERRQNMKENTVNIDKINRRNKKIEEDFVNAVEKNLNTKKLDRIINSLLETDLYKYSMGQAIYHQFPDYITTWTFKCRNTDVMFTKEMVDEIKRQIKMFCELRYTEEELDYLKTIKWLKPSYIDFLRLWRPRYEDFTITTNGPCGISIEATGTWLNTSMYEIPTLAIVNEVYFRMKYNYKDLLIDFENRLDEKINNLISGTYNIGAFSEFGLRRRLSAEAQDMAVKKFADAQANHKFVDSIFVGTSNVYLAKKYNLLPVGTMAHEWIMCVGQGNHKHNPAYSNYYAMDAWVIEYKTLNGTALTDAITTDCFLKDFDLTFATLFSGVRHDSGDPIEWGEKIIKHYEEMNIDPKTKTLLFSDSLDFKRANDIYNHFKGRAKVAFGIGTYISNDTSVPALNIVMKTTACNNQDVAKISDVDGKGMCKNEDYVAYLKRCIKWRMEHED